jgi:hypothetical protein
MATLAPEHAISPDRVLLRVRFRGRSLVLTRRTALVLAAATLVYVVSQWNALTHEYWIMDDVRQQVYWMQRWLDPALFPGDLLSRYAQDYVPWGVQFVYYLGSFIVNPVQFTKVVALILYVAAMGFIYGFAKGLRDDFTAVAIVCVCFFFPGFMTKISGGLSQGFAYPFLAAYLYFSSTDKPRAASWTILLQSLFNPYIFTLCVATHGLYVLHRHVVPLLRDRGREHVPWVKALSALIVSNLPVIAGIALMLLKYLVMQSPEFGEIVTWNDMIGNPEYSEHGRTDDLPPPSIFWELILPWTYFFPFRNEFPALFYGCLAAVCAGIAVAFLKRSRDIDMAGLRMFAYLLPASIMLYAISYYALLRLFIPNRYIEFSFTIFYAVLFGTALSAILRRRKGVKVASPVILIVIALLGGLRNYNVSIYDYSQYKPLYNFIETLPKDALIAGHPELMDNIPTFARRKAFVTYELSHPYRKRYWEQIKKRLFDLFNAYYSENSDQVREFAANYDIDYIIVRDDDFPPHASIHKSLYFEPFGQYIRKLLESRRHFALMSDANFDVVFKWPGLRVVKVQKDSSRHTRR